MLTHVSIALPMCPPTQVQNHPNVFSLICQPVILLTPCTPSPTMFSSPHPKIHYPLPRARHSLNILLGCRVVHLDEWKQMGKQLVESLAEWDDLGGFVQDVLRNTSMASGYLTFLKSHDTTYNWV